MLEKTQNPAVLLSPSPHSPQERCWQLAGFWTKTAGALYMHLKTRIGIKNQNPKILQQLPCQESEAKPRLKLTNEKQRK